VLKRLARLGWYRGVLGGSRRWATLWLAVTLGRWLRRALVRDAEVLTTERLGVGQAVLVTSLGPPPTRRQRRKARRAAR
jgi:hypothetical protein